MNGRLSRWQSLTVALMVTGYAGYYLCRSDLSVVIPLMIREMGARGMSPDAAKIQLGSLASLGVLAYAIGKFPGGWIADTLGGRRNFLGGMAGSILFTMLFTVAGGFPLMTTVWMGNRFVQAMGWPGMVKISSRWFSYSAYGTVMGIISLSYLFGDAAAREFMAMLIGQGFSWRGVFGAAAATMGVLLVLNLLLLKESPELLRLPEPPANPSNLFQDGAPTGLKSLLETFGGSGVFWLICLLSLGVTILRETFNLWTPTYFTQAVGLTVADAAHNSALFPLFGGISVLVAGFLSDRLGKIGRAAIIVYGMLFTTVLLLVLAFGGFAGPTMPVVLVALTAFTMLGPYSYLAGAIALDFGGKQGSATASGLIDGVGYLGGVLAGNSVAQVSVWWGWKGAFTALAMVALLSSVAAGVYLVHQRKV